MEIVELLPSNRKFENYIPAIHQYNRILHKTTKDYISKEIPQLRESDGRYALVTTGSDGRYEKSPLSPIELILLHQGADDLEEIEEEIRHFCKRYNLTSDFAEIKDLRFDTVSNYSIYKDRVFPTRALDSRLIAGNPSLAKRYKEKIIEELTDKTEGKRRVDKFDSQRRYHFNLLLTGVKKDKEHFIEGEGVLFYDGKTVKSTKYSHLRPVQYKLASDIFKSIRAGNLGYDFLEEFPNNTVDRINYLIHQKEISNLGSVEADDLISAYNKALYWYHLSEEEFKLNEKHYIEVDTQELREVTRVIKKFSQRPQIFSSQSLLF